MGEKLSLLNYVGMLEHPSDRGKKLLLKFDWFHAIQESCVVRVR